MPFGEKPGYGSLLQSKPAPMALPRGYEREGANLIRPQGEGDQFRGPNQTIRHIPTLKQQSTFTGLTLISESVATWSPQSAVVYNYCNQWLKLEDSQVFIPPYTMLGPIQIRPGSGELRALLALPDVNYVAVAAKDNQFVTIVWQEEPALGPTLAIAFTGP